MFVLLKMFTVIDGFKKMKTEYESYSDFDEVYALLTYIMTREIDGYILQDGFLFLGRKLCIS